MPSSGQHLRAWLAALAALPITSAVAQQRAPYGSFVVQVDELHAPRDAAIDTRGRVYIADTDDDRVRVFDRTGGLTATWPQGEGELCRPRGVACGLGDELYVADSGNHRIAVLDGDGRITRTLGGKGAGPGELVHPLGLTVAGSRVYVADSGNHRIVVFDADGTARATIGTRGAAPGALERPSDVAVDGDGNVIVVDAGNHRVQMFDAAGDFLRMWGEWGTFPGLFADPRSVAVVDDRVLVCDRLGHRVQVFDPLGNFVYQWGTHALIPREGEGRIHYPEAIAVAPNGRFVVVVEAFENRYQAFGAQSNLNELEAGGGLPARTGMESHFGDHVDVHGRLAVVWEPETRAPHVFDMQRQVPIFITRFGEPGRTSGLIGEISGIAFDDDLATMWLSDPVNRKLQVFRLRFQPERPIRFDQHMAYFVKAFDLDHASAAAGLAPAIDPGPLRHGADGRLYLIDRYRESVLILDETLNLLGSFGGFGTDDGRFREPSDLAIDPVTGNVHVVDAGNRRIQTFDASGAFITAWSEPLRRPHGIAVSDEAVYVSDTELDQVLGYDKRGKLSGRFGQPGMRSGQFWNPTGLAIDDELRLVVVDHGNHRLQIFEPDGRWAVVFGVGRAFTNDEENDTGEADAEGDPASGQ